PQKERPLLIPAINNKEKEIFKNYQPPPLDLLESERGSPTAGDIKMNSAIIKKTLQNFDIPVEMSEVNIGPTVTQYTLKPAEGIKLSRILTLSNDLALSLAASSIRIEAPIPGKSLVGIEVPNKVRTLVRLRNSIEHPNFQNSLSNLTFVLGQDVSGRPVFADLARMPHLLVAGSTGTGKTICLSSIILSLLYRNNPDTLKLILVDPKRVDFAVYNNLPHLLTPVIRDAQTTVNVLKWLISEMERRFEVMALAKARNISSYNEKIKIEENSKDPKEESSPQFMPYIVLVIDELADLMVARGREIEASVVRLAQMARAVGIHLIVATQRPSVEVITGLIKANITSRITFQVASQVDSRTVLDVAGAEKLLGLGDMLFISAEIVKPKRIQGTFVLDKELKRVVKFIIDHQTEVSVTGEEISLGEELSKSIDQTINEGEGKDFFSADDDPLYEEAKRLVIEARKASASLLQRRLRIGYARSARLLDILEERGIVGPGEGAKPREVYVQTKEEEKEEE
ncbi:MAG TPA: DNA translocase FtsK, partial [Candidatus Parcubacteria bacterium]|nr:DNA translocase FtsK [Candidatus Parcubacteria bacterium]